MFRVIDILGINTRHAITINYLVASITGFVIFGWPTDVLSKLWFWFAAIKGVAFYLVFRVMARTAQINGVAVAGIATKMSVLMPVAVGLIVLGESIELMKILGIVTGVSAVILSAVGVAQVREWRWPILAFLGTGAIDSSFKLLQVWILNDADIPQFTSVIFVFAFAVGLAHHATLPQKKFASASLISGAILGIFNFGSVYFILLALSQPNLESSIVFPINNFGVVLGATIIGVVAFREKLTVRGWLGLATALTSIVLLYISAR
ncbi:MAG: hypothetical protein AAF434_08145 [Pseudomonadota bacterium]